MRSIPSFAVVQISSPSLEGLIVSGNLRLGEDEWRRGDDPQGRYTGVGGLDPVLRDPDYLCTEDLTGWSLGRVSGSTSNWMFRAARGCRLMKPWHSSVSTIW